MGELELLNRGLDRLQIMLLVAVETDCEASSWSMLLVVLFYDFACLFSVLVMAEKTEFVSQVGIIGYYFVHGQKEFKISLSISVTFGTA